MAIKHIIIKNYKSLENLDFQLNPLMVFVGPNNAGKSNIFDCFSFLSSLVKTGADAVQKRGGFEQIVFNGDITRRISVELQGSIRVGDKNRFYRYFIEFEADRWGVRCYNKKEVFSLITEKGEQKLLEFPSEKDTAIVWDETGKEKGGIGAEKDRPYLYHFGRQDLYPILGHFSNEVQNWGFFNFLPPLMRSRLPVRKEFQLQIWGKNLPVVLHTLQTECPQKFKEIRDILKTAIPELEELTTGLTTHEQGRTYTRIQEKGLKIPTPAEAMSDGSLRLLGYLATLYLPTLPPLVCFEEPENYVHPRLLELITDLLDNASEKTQVLVSTHSPYLVDSFKPRDLIIVEKKDGRTQVKRAEDKRGIKEALKTLGLGEMWYSGGLGGVP